MYAVLLINVNIKLKRLKTNMLAMQVGGMEKKSIFNSCIAL